MGLVEPASQPPRLAVQVIHRGPGPVAGPAQDLRQSGDGGGALLVAAPQQLLLHPQSVAQHGCLAAQRAGGGGQRVG